MYESPPILSGSPHRQLAELRDYLVRLSRALETQTVNQAAGQEAAEASSAVAQTTGAALAAAHKRSAATEEGSAALPTGYGRLRELVVKTADNIQQEMEQFSRTLRSEYLAVSDFGAYQEQIQTQIIATARQVVESYDYLARLQALDGEIDAIDSALTTLQGQIRRGLITDPETGEEQLGIAIGQQLHFTETVRTENGLEYRELSPGQTLGLYTASGWQFWINGSKRGWFDSTDGMLHVSHLAADTTLHLAGDWTVTADGGFGVRVMQ